MRSEERSGIVAIVLVLLWGTLITEPFRYFATIISDFLFYVVNKTPVAPNGKIATLIVSLLLMGITVLLLNLSKTNASDYYAPLFSSLSLIVFLLRCLKTKSIDAKLAAVLIISVVLVIGVMLLKNERIWIWLSDVFIFSFPAYLLSAWVFKPIANMSAKVSKYMFLCFKSEADFASKFGGVLTIPGIVWGIFFAIILMLPVLYFVVGRRKG